MFLGIREELSYLSSTLSIIPKISTSFYPVTSKEQVIVCDLRSRFVWPFPVCKFNFEKRLLTENSTVAEGYARASGKPGVVLVTSGPGATNVITPMQDALSDGTPLVVFCGQVVTTAIGSDAFQEADVVGISRACTKWNVMVKTVAELPKRINEAFEIATSGRPGPVLVDLPKDVQAAILRKAIPMASTLPSHPSAASLVARDLSQRQLEGAIKRVARLINIAQKPVIYAGQGVLALPKGPKLLKELADKACIPVTTTVQGLGGFDELDEKSLHMLGMHGSAYANMAMQDADLIIALGARFDDRVTGN